LTISVLQIEKPLFASDDYECEDGGEEADNGDDYPAGAAVEGKTDAIADGLAFAELEDAVGVFDLLEGKEVRQT